MMYEIRNSAEAEDTLDIFIYSSVQRSWWDEDAMDADKFRKAIQEHKNAKNVNLYINSYGGSVNEGVAIYSQIKRLNAHVTAYIDGFACSIASVIPMAADKIVMSDVSMMMIHNPWTWAMGNSKELKKVSEDLDKILENCIIPAYKAKCGDKISDEKLIELIDGETYLSAKECLEYGFCDEVLESSDEEKKEEAKKAVDDAVNKAKEEFMNQICKKFADSMNKTAVSAKANPEAVKTAAVTAEIAAEKQQSLANAVINTENAEKNSVNAAEKQREESHENVRDVTDTNVGNIENASEPTKGEKSPEPAEDTKAKANELFMKLLKGEM